jgi:hypothetical protein
MPLLLVFCLSSIRDQYDRELGTKIVRRPDLDLATFNVKVKSKVYKTFRLDYLIVTLRATHNFMQ